LTNHDRHNVPALYLPDPAVPIDEPPLLDGPVQRRDADGQLVEEAHFNVGRLHGLFRLWAPDGTLRREVAHVDGLADGLATDYDDAGQKLAETQWQAGQRHGEARLYTDGRLVQTMQWQHGRLEGPLRVYAPSGGLAAVMPHRAGRLHGTVQLYYPDGHLMLEAEHANGLRHGPSVRYDADGQAVERVVYVEGRPEEALPGALDKAPADPLGTFYAGLAQERSIEPDRPVRVRLS
jgi:antitoxin component YwqK of YwqJK toxin-antitoxin module